MQQLALEHLNLHHGDADGWITLAQKGEGRFKQYHYKLDEIEEALPEWLGDDLYFSQNTFFTTKRRIEHYDNCGLCTLILIATSSGIRLNGYMEKWSWSCSEKSSQTLTMSFFPVADLLSFG